MNQSVTELTVVCSKRRPVQTRRESHFHQTIRQTNQTNESNWQCDCKGSNNWCNVAPGWCTAKMARHLSIWIGVLSTTPTKWYRWRFDTPVELSWKQTLETDGHNRTSVVHGGCAACTSIRSICSVLFIWLKGNYSPPMEMWSGGGGAVVSPFPHCRPLYLFSSAFIAIHLFRHSNQLLYHSTSWFSVALLLERHSS